MDSEKELTLQELAAFYEHEYQISNIKANWGGNQKIIQARIAFSKQAYNLGYQQKEIADFFGQADHSTVSRYINSNTGKVRPYSEQSQTSLKNRKKQKPTLYNILMKYFKKMAGK